MGTFWHKNHFHPSNTKIGSKKPSNLAKELWENARGFIVSEAMKNLFSPFFSNSKVENCWYYGILVRLWFGWPNQLVRWFGRTSPNRLVRPNPNPNRTVRSLTTLLYLFLLFFGPIPCMYFLYRKNCGEVHLINAIIYSRLSRLRTIECTRCNDYICLIFVLCSQRPKQIHQIIVSFPCILFFWGNLIFFSFLVCLAIVQKKILII